MRWAACAEPTIASSISTKNAHAFEALALQIERIVRPPADVDVVVPISAKQGRRK